MHGAKSNDAANTRVEAPCKPSTEHPIFGGPSAKAIIETFIDSGLYSIHAPLSTEYILTVILTKTIPICATEHSQPIGEITDTIEIDCARVAMSNEERAIQRLEKKCDSRIAELEAKITSLTSETARYAYTTIAKQHNAQMTELTSKIATLAANAAQAQTIIADPRVPQ